MWSNFGVELRSGAPPSARATAAYTVTMSYNPQSTAAVSVMKTKLRPGAHAAAPPGTYALVGGTTAVFADIQRAVNHDYAVVFPVAALIILVILALLLRSLVAPWYLMISVGLGFAATLGASVLVFQGLAGQPGLVFLLPVYMYLFVVALGTDYNILMIARLREEAKEGMEPRQAAAVALQHAGPTIGAAGLILAGTFALADPGRKYDPFPAGIRRVLRDRARRLRDGHVFLAQPHHAHRPLGMVARPRGPASSTSGTGGQGRCAVARTVLHHAEQPKQEACGPGDLEHAEFRQPGTRDTDSDRVGQGKNPPG